MKIKIKKGSDSPEHPGAARHTNPKPQNDYNPTQNPPIT